jgi:hypothetical protein
MKVKDLRRTKAEGRSFLSIVAHVSQLLESVCRFGQLEIGTNECHVNGQSVTS